VVTDVLPMVTNVYPMVAEESSCKNWWKIRKMEKDGFATLLLPNNYPISRYYWWNLLNW
jgi:hypothetical protein